MELSQWTARGASGNTPAQEAARLLLRAADILSAASTVLTAVVERCGAALEPAAPACSFEPLHARNTYLAAVHGWDMAHMAICEYLLLERALCPAVPCCALLCPVMLWCGRRMHPDAALAVAALARLAPLGLFMCTATSLLPIIAHHLDPHP